MRVLFRTQYIPEKDVWEIIVGKQRFYVTDEVFNQIVSDVQNAKGDEFTLNLNNTIIRTWSNQLQIAALREYLELVQASFKEYKRNL